MCAQYTIQPIHIYYNHVYYIQPRNRGGSKCNTPSAGQSQPGLLAAWPSSWARSSPSLNSVVQNVDKKGLVFNPATQSSKVIAVWKEIEPLPRVIENPPVIVTGMIVFGLIYAFVYRSVAPAWPSGIGQRASRLAAIVWFSALFSEFMGPFNVLHQPLNVSVIAWSFWAVAAIAEALAIVYVLESGSRHVQEVQAA
jgi:hypothetical protein